jgi:uncharacterized protein YdcH (DUF465 family)
MFLFACSRNSLLLRVVSELANVGPNALSSGHEVPVMFQARSGVHMFENEQSIVQALITDNKAFKELYKKHHELKSKVSKAGMRTLALNDDTLNSMKREKLHTKDRMAKMVDDYRREHAG